MASDEERIRQRSTCSGGAADRFGDRSEISRGFELRPKGETGSMLCWFLG